MTDHATGKQFKDRESQRFMKELTVNDPQIIKGVEWISITLFGQSFLLHMIVGEFYAIFLLLTHAPSAENYMHAH